MNKKEYISLNEDAATYEQFKEYLLPVPMAGVTFDLFDPKPELISMEFVFHGLGGLLRYAAGTPRPISVAEHSMQVATFAKAARESAGVQLACYLHDATEVFLGEIVKPVKDFLKDNCPGFVELFHKWDKVLMSKYGIDLTPELEAKIKKYDIMATQMELAYFNDCRIGKEKNICHMGYMFNHYNASQASHLLQVRVSDAYVKYCVEKEAKHKAEVNQGLVEAISKKW